MGPRVHGHARGTPVAEPAAVPQEWTWDATSKQYECGIRATVVVVGQLSITGVPKDEQKLRQNVGLLSEVLLGGTPL